ncbi:TolC family protein [Limnohabitans sp. yimb22184]|uniref:TolC family protein n=1 Tax=Limnohabitans sp. YIMB22184 TaxID=3374104 RepID=UPI003A86E08F
MTPHTWCLAAALLPSWCCAQSLQEAVWMALANYPSIASAKSKTEAARSDITRAKGAHWPQLSWSGTYSDYRNDALGKRWTQTPTLSLNLWSGGRIQSDVERSEALAKASQKQEQITRDDVALLSSEAYLQWAHARQMVSLAQQNLSTHDKILQDFQTITQVDPGRRIDLNQAQVRHDNARLVLLKNETERAVAAERLARMLMAPAPAEPSGLDFSPPVPYASLDQAQAQLGDQHPVIARLLAQREAAAASIRYAQAQNAPTVNLTHAKSTTPGITDGQFVTQLQLNLPLFDGGTARGAVGVATANLQALESDLQETRLILSEELASAWASWLSSSSRATMGQQQALTAQDLARGYVQQFRVGRRSLLDLLNIQSDLYTYQSNAATALHESRLSQARILASLGQLANAYAPSATARAPAGAALQAAPDTVVVTLAKAFGDHSLAPQWPAELAAPTPTPPHHPE